MLQPTILPPFRGHQVQVGECHGTGTALGDPIEIGAMKSVQCLGAEWINGGFMVVSNG
jgi:3-oxoacyl-(acyl-carrier-protein) synthase